MKFTYYGSLPIHKTQTIKCFDLLNKHSGTLFQPPFTPLDPPLEIVNQLSFDWKSELVLQTIKIELFSGNKNQQKIRCL